MFNLLHYSTMTVCHGHDGRAPSKNFTASPVDDDLIFQLYRRELKKLHAPLYEYGDSRGHRGHYVK
jgi:hypothetical protein